MSFAGQKRAFSIAEVIMLGILILAAGSNILKASGGTQTSQNSAPTLPPGYPGGDQVSSIGDSLIPMIENSSQFQSLSNGTQYHTQPYSSFGYSWGPGIASIETIIFYSPNLSGEIEANVYLNNDTIQHMYFDNETLLGYSTGPAVVSSP